MSTLGTILKDNWEWRSQIVQLAFFDLKKQSRGAVLGWAWFILRPAVYMFCFWFALSIGLRVGNVQPGMPPYILWLACGILPWFFMQKILGQGVDVMHSYSYLVKKIKFPHSAISTMYVLSAMIIQLMLQVALFAIYFICGQGFDWYLLQVPLLLVLMFVFWDMFSIMMSQFTAVSKDVKNFMGAITTPLFWLSGVLFSIKDVHIDGVQQVLYFNPISFFVTGFRDALYEKTWIWDDPMLCIGFAIVFALTLAGMLISYSRLDEGVVDVL